MRETARQRCWLNTLITANYSPQTIIQIFLFKPDLTNCVNESRYSQIHKKHLSQRLRSRTDTHIMSTIMSTRLNAYIIVMTRGSFSCSGESRSYNLRRFPSDYGVCMFEKVLMVLTEENQSVSRRRRQERGRRHLLDPWRPGAVTW